MKFMVFGLIGFLFVPIAINIFYRYLDQRQYVKYTAPITFDKDTYAPCETQFAHTRVSSSIDTTLAIHSRLYLYTEVDGQFVIVKEYTFPDTFLKATPEIELVSPFGLDCDLKEGVYFYKGIAEYKVRGIDKTVSFESVTFMIKIPSGPQIEKVFVPIVKTAPIPTPRVIIVTVTPSPKPKGKP